LGKIFYYEASGLSVRFYFEALRTGGAQRYRARAWDRRTGKKLAGPVTGKGAGMPAPFPVTPAFAVSLCAPVISSLRRGIFAVSVARGKQKSPSVPVRGYKKSILVSDVFFLLS
jgi:hypothetical protein